MTKTRLLVALSFGLWACGGDGVDLSILEAAKERRYLGAAETLAESDVVFYGEVQSVHPCSVRGSLLSRRHPMSDHCRIAQLKVLEEIRGPSTTEDIKSVVLSVLFFDRRGDGTQVMIGLVRSPVGRPGSRGIYFLIRRGEYLIPTIGSDRSYVPIDEHRYVSHEASKGVERTVAINHLNSALWNSRLEGDVVNTISAAVQLAGLSFVQDVLVGMTEAQDTQRAVSACIVLNSYFAKPTRCAASIERRAGLSGDDLSLLHDSVNTGDEYVKRLLTQMSARETFFLSGLLNAAPNGPCEFFRLSQRHESLALQMAARRRALKECR